MKCSHNVLRWNCDSCSREVAEKALGEIMVLCGYPNPAEGEGTSPEEVVAFITKRVEELEKESHNALSVLADVAKERDSLKAALRECARAAINLVKNDSPYPLNSVSDILVEGIQILLNEKNYDGYAHERLAIARNYATLIPKAVELLKKALSNPIVQQCLQEKP